MKGNRTMKTRTTIAAALAIAIAFTAPAFADTNCPPIATSCSTTDLHWTGTGHIVTRPFHVDGEWEVQWSIKTKNTYPGNFSVLVYEKGDESTRRIAANQIDDSTGSAYQPKGGDYYLEINGDNGTWSVCAVPI